ncbi:dTDP-4-dehydrorhamnose 3,5-epimerase [Rhodovulum sulfidophilum]|uniref:dTDP-4-dehydrorhamnose 3,5-epimerase n=1 Tax=Rhodovulum visakhapatnamense TaxID=364297 RepID=A0ABS1RBH5_9RHOB|nr:dTDP-4-dehydrorhamnose 3,5-epimerase [Rhodovulum visakhapatnamense]MBL3577001.1 dTDP-4-dehydrorhamnose 3,5-epimerase [Rhodovulum visakhapatnamense]OLS46168.1 dTDP-4-dehydrorhamnose 3,5-epimerase [Rhodovulum sulfidophilum]
MRLTEGDLPGLYLVESPVHADARGSFARAWCRDTFRAAGIDFDPVQANLSANTARHTLRGLHYQDPPYAEAKLVRCVAGRIWDVAVDLRPGPGYGRWQAVELSAERANALFLPEGLAHGFLTLTPGAVVLYHMGAAHVPGQARGIRWDDPDLAIAWPAPPEVMSEADRAWPGLAERT